MAHRLRCSVTADLPRSKIEPMSPALAGRFFTTEPPERSFCRNLAGEMVGVGGPGRDCGEGGGEGSERKYLVLQTLRGEWF